MAQKADRPIKVIFWGTPEFVLPVLQKLYHSDLIQLQAVVTAPDRPAGRGMRLTASPVKSWAQKNNLPVFTPDKSSLQSRQWLDQLPPADICLLAAYGQIIPLELLNWPKHGFVNLHPSLLPRYRGASPVAAAIIRGDKLTGMSFMLMDQKLDHGPVIAQFDHPIDWQLNRAQLTQQLFERAAQVVDLVIKHYLAQTSPQSLPFALNWYQPPQAQDHSQASFTPMFDKQAGYLSFDTLQTILQQHVLALSSWPEKIQKLITDVYQDTQADWQLYRLVKGLNPWPGVWTVLPQTINSKFAGKRVKLVDAQFDQAKQQLGQLSAIPAGGQTISWSRLIASSV